MRLRTWEDVELEEHYNAVAAQRQAVRDNQRRRRLQRRRNHRAPGARPYPVRVTVAVWRADWRNGDTGYQYVRQFEGGRTCAWRAVRDSHADGRLLVRAFANWRYE